MNDDLISRRATIDFIKNHSYLVRYDGNSIEQGMTVTGIEQALNEMPSIQPKQKTGRWIDIMVEGMPAQACDQCNTFYPLAYTGGGHKYCPNCGAKMDE